MKTFMHSHPRARIALAATLVALLLAPLRLVATPASAAPSSLAQPSVESAQMAESQWIVPSTSDADNIQADDSDGGDASVAPTEEEATPQEDSVQSGEAQSQDGTVDSRVTPSSRGGARPVAQSAGERIVSIARQYLGAPYRWSGTSPAGFDCSGFTWFVYGQAGFPVPRDLGGQLGAGPSIDMDGLQPGDLLIFSNTYARGLSHSGVYIGNGQFIDSQDEWHGVVVNSLDEWARHFAGASRPWGQ
jgi:cell wall-associated NlpC family hydrolase